ncbi:MAG TPA: hypothetical protein VMV07_22955 [Streptosporangiaceae bacterium]|nr:hypothetical protein [Streptosporangiaceae bacterium]
MTVHVISVGVSLRDSLADPGKSLRDRPELVQVIEDLAPQRLLADKGIIDGDGASAWLSSALATPGSPERDDAAAGEVADLSVRTRPGVWPDSMSAELGTFARVQGTGLLSRADIAVLVCSDTSDGLVSGLWNSVALAGGDLGRLNYLPVPERALGQPRGQAILARVRGLNAGDERGFRQAMRGLGQLGHNLLQADGADPAEPFKFYLSGGFKAAIPYLIGVAEGLRSIDPKRSVTAYVLHEATKSEAIRLPLRHLLSSRVRQELSDFGKAGRKDIERDVPALLEGYGYEREGGMWQLTAFGEGLRAMFGLLPEGLQ